MDASDLPSDMRYALLNNEIAELIDDMDNEDIKVLLEILQANKDCVCGCRGLSHITITTDDGRRRRLSGRLPPPANPLFLTLKSNSASKKPLSRSPTHHP
jgi:hypothetical protein